MGSGIIYAVIIVMWAAYFIPRWIKRHEELSESRSVERFDRAMRILSRRDPTPDRRYVVMPPRPAAPRRSVPRTPTARARAAASRAAVRRRRVLAGLLLTTLVVAALTPVLPALPWWAPVASLLGVAGYLVHLRVQVRRSLELTRSRAAVRRSVRSRLLRFDALDRLMSVRRELAEERAAERARWDAAEDALRLEREAEERRAAEEAGGWQPVPVPLPTYVTKPVVPRPAPSIDLTRPGAWSEAQLSGARVVDGSPATAAPAADMAGLVSDAEVADDELEAIIERRAVND